MIEHKLIKDLARRLVTYQLADAPYDPLTVETNVIELLLHLSTDGARHVAGYRPFKDEVTLELIPDTLITSDFTQAVEDAKDIVLVPLTGFTRTGYRLGHGQGFYDRLLSRPGLTTIGVGRTAGEVFFVPEAHDVPLQYIVTEDGIIGGLYA